MARAYYNPQAARSRSSTPTVIEEDYAGAGYDDGTGGRRRTMQPGAPSLTIPPPAPVDDMAASARRSFDEWIYQKYFSPEWKKQVAENKAQQKREADEAREQARKRDEKLAADLQAAKQAAQAKQVAEAQAAFQAREQVRLQAEEEAQRQAEAEGSS